MNKIDRASFGKLKLGSYFLSAGGGFESSGSHLFALHQLLEREVSVLSVESLNHDDCVVLFSFLGGASLEAEKNHNRLYFERLIQRVRKTQKKEIAAIVTLGVGGGVPFLPVFLSSHFNIPLLDADCAGRCFSSLQMISTHFAGIMPKKAFVANVMGEFFEIECKTFRALERHARRLTNSSGGLCIIVPQVLTGEEAKRGLITGTLTQAMTIGQIIQDTQCLSMEEACGVITEYTKGKFIGVGKVVQTRGLDLPHPFTKHIVIKNEEEDRTWEIWMDNEFNLLFENGVLVAEVPDIVALCDVCTREPLTINQLRLSENVVILTMPAPDIWYTEKGLALVRTKDHQDGKIALCGPASSVLKKIA